MDLKLAVVPGVVRDKRVVVVDDSIVRGTTSRRRIAALRKAGAKEIHLRISCPPIRHPCYFGIDFPSRKELVAAQHTIEEIRQFIGADSLAYLRLEGLLAAFDQPGDYCTGCFSGKYPAETAEPTRRSAGKGGAGNLISAATEGNNERRLISTSHERQRHNSELVPARRACITRATSTTPAASASSATCSGEKSHDVIHKALQILVNLSHRGACGCDEKTGDGAGILMQLPHAFLVSKCGEVGLRLPDEKEYGAGLVFLPRNPDEPAVRSAVRGRHPAGGPGLLGWRDLPVHNEGIGELARQAEPFIRQVFIGRGTGIQDAAHFERKLFVIRKVMEKAVRDSDLPEKKFFYVPSLSCQTLIYKGLLLADQIEPFFPDLTDPAMTSGLALVHQRYSTNTFPTWDLAQPFRFLCHNGEINTLRGNINWMSARQGLFQSDLFGDDMARLFPIVMPGASDSAILDNAVELLYHTGRPLPHAIMMLIPEAWQNHRTMRDEKKAFYEYHACLMEPWDGPASIPFTDGRCIGAVLDRNGLRPSRYTVTHDGFVILASETGVLDIAPANVQYKGRLQPGRMLLVDTERGRIVDDEEIKGEVSRRQPYRAWLNEQPDQPQVPAGSPANKGRI